MRNKASLVAQLVNGKGNGYPLQYSYLENPMNRGARQITVHGVAESNMTEQLSTFYKRNRKIHVHEYLHMNVHNSFVYSSQNIESIKISIN